MYVGKPVSNDISVCDDDYVCACDWFVPTAYPKISSSIGCCMSPNGLLSTSFSTELSAVFSLVFSFLGSEEDCFESDCF